MSKKAKTSIKKLKNFQKNFSHESKTKISINVVISTIRFLKNKTAEVSILRCYCLCCI